MKYGMYVLAGLMLVSVSALQCTLSTANSANSSIQEPKPQSRPASSKVKQTGYGLLQIAAARVLAMLGFASGAVGVVAGYQVFNNPQEAAPMAALSAAGITLSAALLYGFAKLHMSGHETVRTAWHN